MEEEETGEEEGPPVMRDEQRNHQGNWRETHLLVLREAKNERAVYFPQEVHKQFLSTAKCSVECSVFWKWQ